MSALFSRLLTCVLVVVLGLPALMVAATAVAQDAEMVSLNSVPKEDVKDLERLSAFAQLVKPYCPSMLPEELAFPAVPVVVNFPPGIKALWLEAARQPKRDLKLQAAEAVARAHALGMNGLEDTAPLLVEMLDADEADPVVRLAAARGLIAVDARQSAAVLKKHTDAGLDLAQLIEPALADWNEPSMRSVWLSRLEGRTGSPGLLALAMQAAAKTNLTAARPHLRNFVFDPKSPPHLRVEAAKALGVLAGEEVVADARALLAAGNSGRAFLSPLLAAYLLARQSGPQAEELLLELAANPQPATAALALQRLMELEPQLTRPVLDHALKLSDAKLRTLAAEALFLLQRPDDIARLSTLLDDPHPQVRSRAQQRLIESDGTAELGETVREAAMRVLNSEGPRGIAQAAIVVGTLDHEPAADRLVELLDHEAGDVSIAAAWALRRLTVPATAEGVYEYLRLEVEDSLIERPKPSRGGPPLDWIWDMYEQHKHLIELLGLLAYEPAEPLLRQFIPYPPNPPLGHPFVWIHCTHRRELRSRAMWALGQIHAGQPPEDLVPLLVERMMDMEEVSHVAAMIAVSLGRMNAVEALPALREFYQPGMSYTESAPPESVRALACRKALEWMTGDSFPLLPVEPYTIYKTNWFLQPLDVGDAGR